MIAVLLVISLLQLSTGAVLKQSDSMKLGLDDSLGGMMYELPEYEDPQMLEYELSQLGDHPLVSLIHLAKKHVHNNRNKHVLSKEALSNIKLQLDSVVTRLQTVQARLESDNTEVPVEDIQKSIQDLQKLEHVIRPNFDQLMTAMHQGPSHSEKHPLGGLLNVRSRHPPAVEVTKNEADIYELRPLTTETPVHAIKPLSIKLQVHKLEVLATKAPAQEIEVTKPPVQELEVTKPPVHEIESLATEPPVHEIEVPVTKPPVYEIKPLVTEGPPVFALPPPPATEEPKGSSEEERSVPYKDEVFKSESFKERYEMNPYQSRWTWKTASFVK